MQCCMLDLVASDQEGKSGFWSRVERLWAVPCALGVTGLLIGMVVQRDNAPIREI